MLKLYFAPRTRSVRIRWLLEELGIPHELERVEFRPQPTPFAQATPFGKFPVLVDGDVVMAESGAILEYVLEVHGNGRLAPAVGSPQRGEFLQWVHFAEGTAFPPLGVLIWHGIYRADAARIPCAESFFTSLLSVESIYYCPNLEGAFEEVHRILRSGGKAHFLINYYKENIYAHPWAKYIDIPVHLLSTEDYLRILASAGFSATSHRRIVDSTPLPEDWTPSPWFRTRQEQAKFQAEGALLLTAEK